FASSNRQSTFCRRLSRLEDRTKQRILAKPYSRSISTTFEPIKPLDPVIRMRSPAETRYSELIVGDISCLDFQLYAPGADAKFYCPQVEGGRSSDFPSWAGLLAPPLTSGDG